MGEKTMRETIIKVRKVEEEMIELERKRIYEEWTKEDEKKFWETDERLQKANKLLKEEKERVKKELETKRVEFEEAKEAAEDEARLAVKALRKVEGRFQIAANSLH